jgi:taurine dioxygenase
MGPRSHLHEERARLAALEWKHFDLTPLGSTLGAELSGVDLCQDLPEDVFAEIHQALLDYKVIFFRDQRVDAAAQVAFARRFGELELHPFIPPNGEYPELCRFEKSADVAGYENLWHHDVTWREKPSKLAILHAVDVPRTGGDTLFSDMHAAYDGLDDAWKARIDDMVMVHDYMRAFGAGVPDDKKAEIRAKFPPPEHPAAGIHAETGRRYLYVNRVFVDHIKGMTREESLPIIEHLARQAEYPEHQCRFHWTRDAIAIWDNRAVQHYAASDYWPDVRIMERASVIGERPVA